jgi:hypothetical protein
MRLLSRLMGCLALLAACVLFVSESEAQPRGKKSKGGPVKTESVVEFVGKLMAFNKAKDGKLTKEEMIDKRLHGLLDRADTKKQGFVTRADLEALFAREKLDGGSGFDFKGKRPKGPKDKKKPKDA